MVVTNGSMEKVTFNISSELKERVMALKDELKISLSSIYNEAIANYLKQKELERWEKGVTMALQDHEYMELTQDEMLLKEVHSTIAKTLNPTYSLLI